MNIYQTLYNFCKTRNKNNSQRGSAEYTNRMNFLINKLENLGLSYEIDTFKDPYFKNPTEEDNYHNIYVDPCNKSFPFKEDSVIFLAHHDVNNPKIDNCNDNSASVINLLYLATMLQKTNKNAFIVFTDCEEFGGKGAMKLSKRILEGYFGNVKYVVNLELTCWGEQLIVGNMGNYLKEKVKEVDPSVMVINTPFHDGWILSSFGIECSVLGIVPIKNDKPDFTIFNYCHSPFDSIDLAENKDMINFTENTLSKLV